MSTYLLAFIVSDFGYTTNEPVDELETVHRYGFEASKNKWRDFFGIFPERSLITFKFQFLIDYRIYARSDGYLRTTFALDSSVQFLKALEVYAFYGYELPKMYFAAIPDFGAGAMENWGLITYKEQYLIVDEDSHPSYVLESMKVIAHELGHQFLGDLLFVI